jgi:hypothetical protein
MEKHPIKHHAYLSANSLRLRQDDSFYGFSRRRIRLFALIMAAGIIGITLGWRFFAGNNSPFVLSTVDESGYSFNAQFYKDTAIEKSNAMNYLITRTSSGVETSLWVAKLSDVLSCGTNPLFGYTPAPGVQVESSCYSTDRLLFVSDVRVNDRIYQINLASQKPIDVQDARTIFSSVTIH